MGRGDRRLRFLAAAVSAAVCLVANAQDVPASVTHGFVHRCYHTLSPEYGTKGVIDGKIPLGYCPHNQLGYNYANPRRCRTVALSGPRADAPSANETQAQRVGLGVEYKDQDPSGQQPTVGLNPHVRRQKIDGFGGSLAFFTNYITFHPRKAEIYDLLYNELRPTVLRLRNSWEQPNEHQTVDEILQVDEELVREASARLGRENYMLMMSSWSPPARMKANNNLTSGSNPDLNTLRKDESGQFMYEEFAQWWVSSLHQYHARGVVPDHISIQNEPDFGTDAFASCLFTARGTDTIAGYVPAYLQTKQAIALNVLNPPQLIGPESISMDAYLEDELIGSGPEFPIVANHLYAAGDQYRDEGFFQNLRAMLLNARQIANEKQLPKLYMTEYSNLEDHQRDDPLLLARTMHEVLTVAEANLYNNWDLMWGRGFGEGSLLLVDNPFEDPSTWANEKGFYTTRSFWWFRHFTKYVDPGMTRVECTTSNGLIDVLTVCFVADDGRSVMIMINTAGHDITVELTGRPDGVGSSTFYSTLDIDVAQDHVEGNARSLRAKSITTVISYPHQGHVGGHQGAQSQR